MAHDAIESASFEEKQLSNGRKTMIWKPRKGKPKILGQKWLLKNVPGVLDSESEDEFSDTSHSENDVSASPSECADTHPDPEDLGGEISRKPAAVTFLEQQPASGFEVEDWDEELECDPYDADDFYCGSFEEYNLLASYSRQEDSLYNPSSHHVACIDFTPPVRVTEAGQFDDADE
ncbi:PREDICTED: coordinator of PRMT5 and differentiation stimulator [Chaetura pelagica]|uniref:coordinator of PRMT5 and differentiation stimulator n=1 Tax=Chaetura pelagica TaxID=8897 RepID=UPI0005232E71|nr:PREDICTED: coordinator of PRMT5 and differentiation stimulator [Chaetura pelagica]